MVSLCVCVCVGGYSDILYIRRFGLFFWFKSLNFNTFGGFHKKKIIFLEGGVMNKLWISFGSVQILGAVLRMKKN